MKISVIVPTLNEARRVGRLLFELRRQAVDQVVLVDGLSDDATVELARGHLATFQGRLSVISSERGRAHQMNAGASRATGDVLWFVHADVALPDDAKERVREVLADSGTVAGAFKTRTIVDRPGDATKWWQRAAPLWLRLADVRSRYTRLPYGDQAIFVRRAAFERVGGYPPLPLMEDLELMRRLSRLGRIGRADAEVLVSGRRFLRHPLRDTFLVNSFPLLYRAGIPAAWLATLYRHIR